MRVDFARYRLAAIVAGNFRRNVEVSPQDLEYLLRVAGAAERYALADQRWQEALTLRDADLAIEDLQQCEEELKVAVGV